MCTIFYLKERLLMNTTFKTTTFKKSGEAWFIDVATAMGIYSYIFMYSVLEKSSKTHEGLFWCANIDNSFVSLFHPHPLISTLLSRRSKKQTLPFEWATSKTHVSKFWCDNIDKSFFSLFHPHPLISTLSNCRSKKPTLPFEWATLKTLTWIAWRR